MYSRNVNYSKSQSFFLLGPRGTGKSSWVKAQFPSAVVIDLLSADVFLPLSAQPSRLGEWLSQPATKTATKPATKATSKRPTDPPWVIIDEIQKIPALLDEVHRLIERDKRRFVLTGSSPRKLKRRGVNLLGGRALLRRMHPLTARELGADFELTRALKSGLLPQAYRHESPRDFLKSYASLYVREEVQQEGLTRNIGAFARFLESASFSQAQVLNVAAVARDCSVERKVVENYFEILEDLLIGERVPLFSKRAKRKSNAHPKFFFFDAGVFQAIRPRGPLDAPDSIAGPALETLVFQSLRAEVDALGMESTLFYWRDLKGHEVDFVVYGPEGLTAIEVKTSDRIREESISGLKAFQAEYPPARLILVTGGDRRETRGDIECVGVTQFLAELPRFIGGA